jgi:hypothetical protein
MGDVRSTAMQDDECGDVRRSELPQVAPAVEDHETTDPVNVGILGPPTIVASANCCANLIKHQAVSSHHPPRRRWHRQPDPINAKRQARPVERTNAESIRKTKWTNVD